MEAFSSSKPVPDLTFSGWTTRLYRTFSAEVCEKAETLTPASSITRPSSRSRRYMGGSESDAVTVDTPESERQLKEEGKGGDGQDNAAWRPSRRTILVFSSLCILQLMVALDSTSIGTALSVGSKDTDGVLVSSQTLKKCPDCLKRNV